MRNIYSLLQQLCVTEYRADEETRRQDRELAAGIKRGERETFDRAYGLYSEPLYRFAYRRVRREDAAMDIVQDAFVRLLGYRENLDEKKGLKTLLFTITGNLCTDLLRRKGTRLESSLEAKTETAFFQPEDTRHTPDAGMYDRELAEAIARAVDRLPEKEQTAVLYRLEGQLTFAEIAEATGMSDRYVKKLLRQAMDRMAVTLHKEGHADDFGAITMEGGRA